jgi:hypothetical protein
MDRMSDVKFSNEIRAMGAIEDALTPLDEDARARVLRWANERYKVVFSQRQGGGGAGANDTSRQEHELDGELGGDLAGAEKPRTGPIAKYETFAEFYATVSPNTDADRVLVASYWFTERERWTDLQSRPLNQQLRDLGHAVSHMPSAFETLTLRRPQPVVQLRKTGKTKQAIVRYKLTAEGKAVVERMLSDAQSKQ